MNEKDKEIIIEAMWDFIASFNEISYKNNIDNAYNIVGMHKAFNFLIFRKKKENQTLSEALMLYEELYKEGILELIELFNK